MHCPYKAYVLYLKQIQSLEKDKPDYSLSLKSKILIVLLNTVLS